MRAKPAQLSHLVEVREWLQAKYPELAWQEILGSGWRSSRERIQSFGEDQLQSLSSLKHWYLTACALFTAALCVRAL